MRVVDHARIDRAIQLRREWHEYVTRSSWATPTKNYYDIIKDTDIRCLHDFCDVLMPFAGRYKMVVSHNTGYVYTNDLQLISVLQHAPYLSHKAYFKAVIVRPKDTVKLKKSSFSHRTYLKSKEIGQDKKQQLKTFFGGQSNNIRMSPALSNWLEQKRYANWTYGHFFIDHSDAGYPLMVGLVCPGLVRKTVEILVDK